MAFASKIITCLLVLIVDMAASTKSHITCETTEIKLDSCLGYLTKSNDGRLPSECCVGVKSLNQMTKTTPDRRQVCECLKTAANELDGVINIDLLAALPTSCGVSAPYPTSRSANCDELKASEMYD